MNEFEWRRQLRDLRQPVVPQRDLWASIDSALDGNALTRLLPPMNAPKPLPKRQRWVLAAGLAASLLLVGGLGWHLLQAPTATPVARANPVPATWKPDDPRLAGAAIELDAARMELQLAIQQSPDSPALRRLLDRTEQQQTQLRQLARQAG